MPRDKRDTPRHHRLDAVATLRDKLAVRRIIAGEVISLANLLGRPVLDTDGTRVGRVSDVVVHWDAGTTYPRVSGVLVSLGKGFALVGSRELTIEQVKVQSRSAGLLVAKPVRTEGDIALARDVLDHQLVDVQGIQVVRAADVYLCRLPDGWELAGVDVSFWALSRRLLRKRRTCPPPHGALDWANVQTFVPRSTDAEPIGPTGPAVAAGTVGSGIRLGSPAKEFHRLSAKEVAAILSDLGRREQAQVANLVTPSAAAAAVRELSPRNREALLAELSDDDRARLLALLHEDARGD
jgi:sporulation protein YlmC with PRC-barrel domain